MAALFHSFLLTELLCCHNIFGFAEFLIFPYSQRTDECFVETLQNKNISEAKGNISGKLSNNLFSVFIRYGWHDVFIHGGVEGAHGVLLKFVSNFR